MMNKIINRNIELRAITDDLKDKRQAEFVISSEAVDSYNTVFRKDAWQLDAYMRNPLVTYNHSLHSDNPDNIIGTSEVFFDGDLLVGRVTFEDADVNPLAEKVMQKVFRNTLKMASVGAIIEEASFGDENKGEDPDILFFDKATLVEWSIVPAGGNPDAHKRNKACVTEFRAELTPVKLDVISSSSIRRKSVFEAQLIINKNK